MPSPSVGTTDTWMGLPAMQQLPAHLFIMFRLINIHNRERGGREMRGERDCIMHRALLAGSEMYSAGSSLPTEYSHPPHPPKKKKTWTGIRICGNIVSSPLLLMSILYRASTYWNRWWCMVTSGHHHVPSLNVTRDGWLRHQCERIE